MRISPLPQFACPLSGLDQTSGYPVNAGSDVDLVEEHLIPVKRPHYRLNGSSLFFLISKRPHTELDCADAELWQAIDGVSSVGELIQSFPDAQRQLFRLWQEGTIELAEANFLTNRRRVLVVEPHMDDAVLSVGGMMWQRRHEANFTVLSVASESNFTSYHKLDRPFYEVATVSALRRAESEVVMRLLGGQLDVLGTLDAPLRYSGGDWSENWFLAHRRAVSAFTNHSPSPHAIDLLADLLAARFSASDAQELWIPMGIGFNADHEATRNACLAALQRTPSLFERLDVYLYQDTPYVIEFSEHEPRIATSLREAGAVLEPTYSDIGIDLPAKLRLLSVFGSQFKPGFMDPLVVASARHAGKRVDMDFAEARYRLAALPTRPTEAELYSGRPNVEAIARQLRRWYPRRCNARRIRILSPIGVGCWQQDMGHLLDAFPEAVLEVHLSDSAAGEAERLVSARLDVRPVASSARGWLRRISRVLISRPWPMIVVTGNNLWKAAPLVRFALFLWRPLVVTSVDHLVAALRLLEPSPGPDLQVDLRTG